MNRLYYIYARHCLLIFSKNKEKVTFTWATRIQNVLFVTITGDKYSVSTFLFVSYLFCILLFVFTYLFFPLENVKDVPLEALGEYLLITEVKFITSGTIRYNVIKTSY
jgi:hypothetical protein